MSRPISPILLLSAGCLLAVAVAAADDSIKEAAETAEVFVYGQQAKNEELLRAISDPKQYKEMAQNRAKDEGRVNEDVRVDGVEITEIDGDRATATATYSKKHGRKRRQVDVDLIRIDGRWQVTAPPKSGKE
jgi:hypothetical protein